MSNISNVKVTHIFMGKVVGVVVDFYEIFVCENCKLIYNLGEPIRTIKINLN